MVSASNIPKYLWVSLSPSVLFFRVFLTTVSWRSSTGFLSDSKSSQVSRTLLSILADLNHAVAWIVSTCPLIFNYCISIPFTNPLVTVPNAPFSIGITVTFVLHCSQAKSKCLSLFLLSFSFTLRSTGKFSFFCWLLLGGRLAEIRWSVCISKYQSTQRILRLAAKSRKRKTEFQIPVLLRF